jgi:hypothetical protein
MHIKITIAIIAILVCATYLSFYFAHENELPKGSEQEYAEIYRDFTAPQCIECRNLSKDYQKTECLVKYACTSN